MAKNTVVKLEGVHKYFKPGDKLIKVIRGIDFEIKSGEFVMVFGPSGCGKSTILHMIGGLEPPTKGKVTVRGEDWYSKTEDELAGFRQSKIGFVFQEFNLLKSLTVAENVALPLLAGGQPRKRSLARAGKLLNRYGIEKLKSKVPTELSGGEQQRVAMSRALATNPWILIADEPTGNLDSKSAANVMNILCALNRISKRTIFMVTHNPDFISFGTKVIRVKDGLVEKIEKVKNPRKPKVTEGFKFSTKAKHKMQEEQEEAIVEKGASEVKGMGVGEVGFPTRISKALEKSDKIETVGDLAKISKSDLENIKGIGKKSAEKIVKKLSDWGVK